MSHQNYGPNGLSRQLSINKVTSLPSDRANRNQVFRSSIYRKDEYVAAPETSYPLNNNVVVYRNELYQKIPYSVSDNVYR